jgi:hypothetical protein
MSADGNWLLDGFQGVHCHRWDGAHYVQVWSSGMNLRYCGELLISPDTTYAVSCWYATSYNRNYIRVHNLQNGQAIWSYSYRQGTGYQDLPTDVDISADGNWFAVGSWGDQGNQNGEAVVFNRWYPTPYFELNMAGSCFSLDLSSDGEYLLAAGKHVHANVFGNGGDAYVVWMDPPAQVARPVGVDTLLFRTEVVCLCTDTVTFTAQLTNTGYRPFTIDVILPFAASGADHSYLGYSADQIGLVVNPRDTVDIPIRYAPCQFAGPWTYGEYIVDVLTRDDAVVTYHLFADQVVVCDAAREESPLAPASFSLSAYPNPFNPATTLEYTLPSASRVDLRVYDISGREVENLTSAHVAAGTDRFSLDLSGNASGVYFAQVSSQFGVRTEKLMLLK